MSDYTDLTSAKNVGMKIEGQVWAINQFTQQDTGKIFHSVDLAVKGTKQMVNVKLPENFDRTQIVEDDVVLLSVAFAVKNYQGKLSPEFVAIP